MVMISSTSASTYVMANCDVVHPFSAASIHQDWVEIVGALGRLHPAAQCRVTGEPVKIIIIRRLHIEKHLG